MNTLTAHHFIRTNAASATKAPNARRVPGSVVRRVLARLLGWLRSVDRVLAGAARVRGADLAARYNPHYNLHLH